MADVEGALVALVKSTASVGVAESRNENRLRRKLGPDGSNGAAGAGAAAGVGAGRGAGAAVGTAGSGNSPVEVSWLANGLTVRGAGTPWKISGSPTLSSDGNVTI